MEDKEFTCNFIHSPKSIQCFQADKFVKTNNLNIPDTITEQPSVEISGNNLKVEALKATMNDEENISSNLSEKSNDSSVSTIVAIDNSFTVNCERKLLNNSNSDEDKSLILTNKKIENGFFNEITRKFGLNNETISTPQHVLRRQISMLRTEIAEADEFHDLEMEILKEERNLRKGDGLPYEELIEKYLALMDLYSTVKSEYEEYRKEQEKLQIKTADCFESLCSQIEASDSSLNFSCASFISFGGDIKSSTMMGNMSEVEAMVINDATALEHDPLAITQFKTPRHFPSNSTKKLFPQNMEKIEVMEGREIRMQLLDIETAMRDKVKEVEDLEQRLYKVEDLSSLLQAEHERVASEWANERGKLEKNLSNKVEELESLTGKLKTEIIDLNPSLGDSLIDATGAKLLLVFIQTIMESCKGVQGDLNKKFSEEKVKWETQKQEEVAVVENLKKRLCELEGVIGTRDEEIRLLQCHDSRKTREDLALAKEVISKLEAQLCTADIEKKEMALRYQEMEEAARTVGREVETNKILLKEMQNSQSYVSKNESLKKSHEELEKVIVDLRMRIDSKDQNYDDLIKENEGLKNFKLGDLTKVLTENIEVLVELLLKKQEEEMDLTKWISQKVELDAKGTELLSLLSTYCQRVKQNLTEEFKTIGLTSIENLENQIKTLVEKNEKVVSEKGELEKLLKEQKKKISEAEDAISSRDEEILLLKQVKVEAAAAEEIIIKLKSQVLSSQAGILDKEERCHELQEANANLRTLITTKEAILKDLENYKSLYEKMENECEVLKTEIQGSEHVVLNLKTELELVKEERSREAEELESLRKLEATVVVLEGELELAREDIKKKEKETEELKNLENYKVLYEKMENECEVLKTEIQGSEHVVLNLKTELELVKEERSREAEELESLRKSEATVVVLERELELAREDIRKKEKEIEELTKNVESLKQNEEVRVESEDLKQHILKLEEIIESLKKISAELESKIAEAEVIISSRDEEIRSLKSSHVTKIEEVKKSLALAENAESAFRAEKSELEARCKSLLDGNAKLEVEMQSLENANEFFKKAQMENEDLRERILKSEEIIADLRSEMEKARQEQNRNEERMAELANEIEALMNDKEFARALEEKPNGGIDVYRLVREKVQSNPELSRARGVEILSQFAGSVLENRQEMENVVRKFGTEKEGWASEMKHLQDEVRDLSEKNEGLKTLLLQVENRVVALQSQENYLREAKDTAILELQSRLSSTESHQSEMERENYELRKSCEGLEVRVIEAQGVISVRNEEIQSIKASEEEWKRLLAEGEAQKRELEERNAELRTSREALLSKTKEVEREREDLRIEIQQSQKVVRNLETELESAKEERCNMEELVKEIEKLGCSYWDERKKAGVESSSTDRILPTKTALGVKLMTIFTAGLAETKGLEEELRKERSERESQRNVDLTVIESLRNQMKSLEMKISEMGAESEEKKKEVEFLRDRHTGLKEDLAAADEAILRLRSRLGVIESEKSEVETRCRELQEGKESLEAEVGTKKRRVEELEEAESDLKEKLLGAEEVIAGLKGVAAEQNSEMGVLRKEVEFLTREREELEEAVKDLKEQLLKAEEVIAGLKGVAAEQNSEMGVLRREAESLRREREEFGRLAERFRALEENKENQTGFLTDLHSCLEVSTDFTSKLLCGKFENRKILSEEINALVKSQTENLKAENDNLKFGNEQLKEKVRELSELVSESRKASPSLAKASRTKSGRSSDLCVRRLDKLEEINHNLADLVTRILTLTAFPNLEKLKLCSVREFPNIAKQVLAHFNKLESEMEELRTGNAKLDEECDSYAKTIKELKKDAVVEWRNSKKRMETLEDEISILKEEKMATESERQDLLVSISKLNAECQKLKAGSTSEGSLHICSCGSELKKINDMKRILLIKEQKILELQDLEAQNTLNKSQIKYLENALEQEKKKVSEEKEKVNKLQSELKELGKDADKKKSGDEKEILEELKMCGSLSGGIVQEFVDKEKMRKLSKDIGILKELCRARYAEIKRLEAENAALKRAAPKNSNQLDSPIRTRAYNTRNKTLPRDAWKPQVGGKENSVL